jgi:signal transduction histidine kinase/HD-like signal output (HDOD) protein
LPSEAHTKLILEEIDALPTISPVAMRVLEITGTSDADIRRIIRLVESDPSLTARLLSLCRKASVVTAHTVETVERAVILLGLHQVRSALLSVEVFGLFPPSEDEAEGPSIDTRGFWLHSVAVACAAEMLAERYPAGLGAARPEEAFLCGLLHDLGKLALERVLPRAYARVLSIAAEKRVNLADAESSVLGVDHHTAGRRLAERWGLPHCVQDVMWLHALDPVALPQLPHTPTLRAVTAADAIARVHGLGWTGNHAPTPRLDVLLENCGYPKSAADAILDELMRRVTDRAMGLGLSDEEDAGAAMRWFTGANRELGRLNERFAAEARDAESVSLVLADIASTLGASHALTTAQQALGVVARSIEHVTGASVRAAVWQSRRGQAWSVLRVRAGGEVGAAGEIESDHLPAPDLGQIFTRADQAPRAGQATVAFAEILGPSTPLDRLDTIAIAPGHGPAGVFFCDPPERSTPMDDPACRAALEATWGAVLASASRHEGAARVSDELSHASRRIATDMEQRALRMSEASVAEITAGAAHELNNPLTVISGKAQLLASRFKGTKDAESARAIIRAAHSASTLIESVRALCTDPTPDRREVVLHELLEDAVKEARTRLEHEGGTTGLGGVRLSVSENTPPIVFADPAQLRWVIAELLTNAAQSTPRGGIWLRAGISATSGRLSITVEDDGSGMSTETLAHACDPFYSAKPAGRRPGLGLARARRLVEAHGGNLEFVSSPETGTRVSIHLERANWERPSAERPAA